VSKGDDVLGMEKDKILEIIKKNLHLSANALTIIEKRYLRKDEEGKIIEAPEEMFYRVAHWIAQAEKNYKTSKSFQKKVEQAFADVLSKLEFMPNSPTFTGANTRLGQLAACFVLPVEDDMFQIMESLKNTIMIHKSGGGTGFSFSRLRPEGSPVGSSSGIASGPISFMRMYNAATEEIKQGGTRRGANMGILRVDHPDVLKFVNAKKENSHLNNFNISVAVTDKFMNCLKKNEKYELVDPHKQKVVRKIRAKKVFEQIINNAWSNGEPGMIFIDEINRHNPTPQIGEIESTNPCGEQPLLPYESCNLGSINLAKFAKNKKIDWERLGYVTRVAVRFLDDVIDMNKFPLERIAKMTRANRKIGLGVMGFADMLIQLEIPYNSKEAVRIATKIMKFIHDKARLASEHLAQQRGAFPNFKKSVFARHGSKPPRNATLTTIAPTGTISMIAGASSGVEPIFALVYTKNILDGAKLLEINPIFEKIAKAEGFYSQELMEKVAETGMTKGSDEIPEKFKRIFITAREISPEWHIKTQTAFQKYTDNAVSKTINFPNEATKDDIKKAYLLAYESKLKGLTVYRDGSREEQVVDFGKKSSPKKERQAEAVAIELQSLAPRERPEVIQGYTFKTKTFYGNMYTTINEVEGNPFEVFTQIGKAGGFFHANTEAISRLISMALRTGIDPQKIIEQLKGIRDPSPAWTENGVILSLPDAIAKVLERYLKLKQEPLQLDFPKEASTDKTTSVAEIKLDSKIHSNNPTEKQISLANTGIAPICRECGATLVFQEGCFKCPICGYSKCDG